MRVEDGEWTDWLTGTLATAAAYALGAGEWFIFRVIATDNVGNAGSAEAASSLARVTKYYYHGGRRVAMRADGVVYYLHGDHLGSVSLATDADGGFHSRQLFLPYGETRWQEGTLPTDFGFGGQRHDGTGLIFMHARYYHAALGRFVSADTIVPNPLSPQLFNRYSYAGNNPVLYNDPDGHGGPLIVVIALALVVWVSMEMLVGEEAPPHDPAAMYWNGVETGLKWGGDTVGDAYALADEWPENRAINAAALALPLVPAGAAKALRGLEYADEASDLWRWVQRNEHMSESARAYQRFISGRTDDMVFKVGEYTFDAFDEASGVLGDAKAIPGRFVDPATSTFKPWVSGTDTWLQQAANQVETAGGVPVAWYFDNQAARDAMYNLFLEQDPGLLESIDLVFKPMP